MKPWNMNVLVESTDPKSMINVSRSEDEFTVALFFLLVPNRAKCVISP